MTLHIQSRTNSRSAPPAEAMLESPLPADWTVQKGLQFFLDENGYQPEDYDAPRTPAMILGVRFSVPNPPLHRWAIMRHDLHHVATGFGTDFVGEGEISAWEFHHGIRPLGKYVGSIVITAMSVGWIIAPRRTRRAWKLGTTGTTLFHRADIVYKSLLEISIGELREILGLPPDGIAHTRRGLNAMAPAQQRQEHSESRERENREDR